MSKRALVTDLDGTIYDWVNFFAPSFRAMVHVLNRVTGLDEELLFQSFQRVYKKRNTLEYSFAIQELDIWHNLNWTDEEIMKDAVYPARVAFGRTRNKHFKLFPNVRDTLKWLRNEEIKIIAITLAPSYQANKRLRYLQVDSYFDCLASFNDYQVPELVPTDVEDLREQSKPSSNVKVNKIYRHNERKPNPKALLEILDGYGIDVNNTYLIGDSKSDDILMAKLAGVKDIWARYGTINRNSKNIETIKKISTYSNEEVQNNSEISRTITPTYIVDDFSDIKDIIGSRQLNLPLDFSDS